MNDDITKIILENQNLIYKLTHLFEKYGNKEDLFQVGVIGLMKAYQKFDSSYETKFTTYAYPYILGEMKKYIREDKGIKISRDITKLRLQIEKASILLSQKLMREATSKELAEFLEVPLFYIEEAMNSSLEILSIDYPIVEDGKPMKLSDVLAEEKQYDKTDLLDLKNAIESLNNEEKNLVTMRFYQDKTQQETAQSLGMSQVQVSRHEQKVLTKLKQKLVA